MASKKRPRDEGPVYSLDAKPTRFTTKVSIRDPFDAELMQLLSRLLAGHPRRPPKQPRAARPVAPPAPAAANSCDVTANSSDVTERLRDSSDVTSNPSDVTECLRDSCDVTARAFVVGINGVTRALERSELAAAAVVKPARPDAPEAAAVSHVPALAYASGTPLCPLSVPSSSLGDVFSLRTCLAFGVRRGAAGEARAVAEWMAGHAAATRVPWLAASPVAAMAPVRTEERRAQVNKARRRARRDDKLARKTARLERRAAKAQGQGQGEGEGGAQKQAK
eukprot:m51a1_g4474 hypothetical protein (279) ;mRNA; r:251280-252270